MRTHSATFNGRRFNLAICGPGESGKDTVAKWLHCHTRLRMGRSTSEIILPHVAERLGVSPITAWRERSAHRDLWAQEGDRLRTDDPAALARLTLAEGDMCVGVRRRTEMEAAISAGLFDLAVWVDRLDVPPDTSLTYGPELCDLVIQNHWGLLELHSRLARLARSWDVQ